MGSGKRRARVVCQGFCRGCRGAADTAGWWPKYPPSAGCVHWIGRFESSLRIIRHFVFLRFEKVNSRVNPSKSAAGPKSVACESASGAVRSLRATFDSGRTRDVQWRLRQLGAIEQLLSDNERAIAEAVGQDLGRDRYAPVTLELGGKSPTIVARDADLAVAARRIVATKLINAGQTCVAPDYILAEREVLDKFTTKLVGEFKKQRADSALGIRVAHRKHAEHIARLLESSGGELALPGLVDPETLKVEPAVVVGPDLQSALMQEEIFGPILPIIPVGSISEATQFVRARPRPLTVYLFTSARRTERQVIAGTHPGAVVINQAAYQAAVPTIPFGGYGSSRGKFGFEEFSYKRSMMTVRTFPDLPLLYPLFTKAKRWLARAMIR